MDSTKACDSDRDERFPKRLRLVHGMDFDRVFKQGVIAADGQLVIHAMRSQLDFTRIGISVSKKVGNSPIRNRWKRLIRESFRKHRVDLPTGMDIVVRPKKDALPDYHKIEASVCRLIRKLDLKLPRIEPQ